MYAVFDLSIFIHANYHIMKKFMSDFSDEQLAYKVNEQITSIHLKKFPMHKLVIVCDYVNNFRKKLSTKYKSSRGPAKFNGEAIYEYMNLRHKCVRFEGLEADDLAFLFSQSKEDVTLISEDNDYLLMLDPDIRLYKPKKDIYVELSVEDLLLERVLKVVKGCDSDEIDSITLKRIGPKTMRKLLDFNLDLFGNLDKLYNEGNIAHWQSNYELAMYDINTYYKYFGVDTINNLTKSL